MSLGGSRGLIRISRNPACGLQAAMVADRVSEPRFYQSVMGRAFEGEYGERVSARRRGAKFEADLYQNRAALLRNALATKYGYNADLMVVRNLTDELPGIGKRVQAARLSRIRRVLRDLAAGRDVPELLIQPQLFLPTSDGNGEYISPDFMILDSGVRMYRPGEIKSFIVRDSGADASDLDGTRRQAAVEILSLRAEAAIAGLRDRVDLRRADFIFSSPYGLSPVPPFEEALDAEIREVSRAIEVLAAARADLAKRRAIDGAQLNMLADELPINFQERCIGTCLLSEYCRYRCQGTARILGDGAVELLGADMPLDRLVALLDGAQPTSPFETEIIVRLRSGENALGSRRVA